MKGQFSFYNSFLLQECTVDYTGQDKRIAFPAEYDNRPVTAIGHVYGGLLPGDKCKAERIEIPASVHAIDERAFAEAPLKKLVFRDVSGWTTEGASIPEETLKDPKSAAEFYADHTAAWKKSLPL